MAALIVWLSADLLLSFRVADPNAVGFVFDGAASVDRFGRLVSFPSKSPIDCAAQDARTAVILAIGQSNIANHAERRVNSAFPARVVGFFHGRCMAAASPLLGASSDGGEWLTLLGDELIRSGRYDRVVIAPAAIGGAPIRRFADEDLAEMIDDVVASLTPRYRVTHVLWRQGESDFGDRIKAETYRALFMKIAMRLRDQGVAAPIFVAVATYCLPMRRDWTAGNPIALAQRSLPDEKLGIWPGVDTDAFDPSTTRIEECHLSARGQAELATAEAKIIEAYDSRGKR